MALIQETKEQIRMAKALHADHNTLVIESVLKHVCASVSSHEEEDMGWVRCAVAL